MEERFCREDFEEFVLLAKEKGYFLERAEGQRVIISPKKVHSSNDKDKILSEIFIALGFLPNLSGTNYLREAVKIETERAGKNRSKMKDLYPLVAKEFFTTAERVERSIRNALEVAWNRGGEKNFNSVFGKNLFGRYSRPTSSELIGLLADKITFG